MSSVAGKSKSLNGTDSKKERKEASITKEVPNVHIVAAQTFTFRELAAATNNFRQECLLGEGGFGRVYKGQLESTGQVCYNRYVGSISKFIVQFCFLDNSNNDLRRAIIGFNHHKYSSIQGANLSFHCDESCYLLFYSRCKNTSLIDKCSWNEMKWF